MGRLTLNVLLSFAQFEREVIGERIRDKIAASKKKGMWMGGVRREELADRRTQAGWMTRISMGSSGRASSRPCGCFLA
jgi:DNA invertase Pin-like site-specific DNA recombinase